MTLIGSSTFLNLEQVASTPRVAVDGVMIAGTSSRTTARRTGHQIDATIQGFRQTGSVTGGIYDERLHLSEGLQVIS